jgi:hypothetical protein
MPGPDTIPDLVDAIRARYDLRDEPALPMRGGSHAVA